TDHGSNRLICRLARRGPRPGRRSALGGATPTDRAAAAVPRCTDVRGGAPPRPAAPRFGGARTCPPDIAGDGGGPKGAGGWVVIVSSPARRYAASARSFSAAGAA